VLERRRGTRRSPGGSAVADERRIALLFHLVDKIKQIV
jgi:hypothetical protein